MEGSCGSDCSVLSAEEQGWWLPAPCAVWVFMFSDVPLPASLYGGLHGGLA